MTVDNRKISDAKNRFCTILRETGRENIDYVIEDLESWGFFEAPASAKGPDLHAQ